MLNRYPRPQLKRDSFLSLDGEWLINGQKGFVPSCQREEKLHYEKSFDFHKTKDRAILHIGAADQIASVSLNGVNLGVHEGGYLPFSFEITNYLVDGNNLLCIDVEDTLNTDYPYGKQRNNPKGMWYTPISGIWKSVWVEEVPKEYIQNVRITPDLKGADFEIIVNTGEDVEIISKRVDIENPRYWTPDDPMLYEESLAYKDDKVLVYFALRTVEIKEVDGVQRVLLNGKPIFLNGVLDQGYWKDTLFIPNEADGYEKDILRMKELGFNTLRKHIKIEDEEFYYQCDRLGMLVVQDMVQNGKYSFLHDTILPTCGFNFKDETRSYSNAREFFLEHSLETVDYLYNHPCIVVWTVFNEGWGQFNSDLMYEYFKMWDQTRLVDAASGWFAQNESDFDSKHIYFRLVNLKPEKRPLFLSECGGYNLVLDEAETSWGYGKCKDSSELTDKVIKLYEKMVAPAVKEGLCGVIYTQLSDVEGETNGLYTFDRKKCKVEKDRLKRCFENLLV